MMTALDLFSAACGGWSLGAHRAGIRTVAACELIPWRRAVYAQNFPGVRLYDDVRRLTADQLVRDIGRLPDVILGSPPCQDASAANTKGRGVEGERTGLFFEALRIAEECRDRGADAARWIALENSPRLRTRGVDRIISRLEAAGYTVWPFVAGADDIGANHERKRVWLLAADAERVLLRQQPRRCGGENGTAEAEPFGVARNTEGDGCGQGRTRGHPVSIAGLPESPCGHAADAARDRRSRGRGWDGLGSDVRVSEGPGGTEAERHAPDAQGVGQPGGRPRGRGSDGLCTPPDPLGVASNPDCTRLEVGKGLARYDGPQQPTAERATRIGVMPDADCEGEPDLSVHDEVGGCEGACCAPPEPWADWNGGPARYLRLDARFRAWAFVALLLDEGGYGWAAERLMQDLRSAGSAAGLLADDDFRAALRTLLASPTENTARNLAPIAEMLSEGCSITLALAGTSSGAARSAEPPSGSTPTTLMGIGPTTSRRTSKRSAQPATPGTTCGRDLKAVQSRAERRLKRYDRFQVSAYGDAVLPQITESICRAIIRVERATAAFSDPLRRAA